MKSFEISDVNFNKLTTEELKRILISFNDGQGDNSVYNWEEIIDLLKDSDNYEETLSNAEIIDRFYEDCELTGNNSNLIYFDGEMKNLCFI